MTEQGYPPRRPDHQGRSGWARIPQEPRGSGWHELDAFDSAAEAADDDPPPWAGPGVQPVRPARRPRAAAVDVVDVIDDSPEPPQVDGQAQDRSPRRGNRPGRSRAAATRRRRSRRRLLTLASVVAVVAVVVASVYYLRQPAAKPGGLITALQKGEYSKVPDACRAIPAAMLTEFVGAAPKLLRPEQGQCTFTVDAQRTFRELTVTIQALQPNAGYGNGSATANATYNFAQRRAHLAKPPRHTPAPPAAITPIGGVGDQAFAALQVFHVGAGAITNEVTVLIRYRNVLISSLLEGGARGSSAPGELRAGALAISRAVLSAVMAQPVVG